MCVIANDRISFTLKADYFIVCMWHIFFIHLAISRYLGHFHLLAIVNNGTVNMGVQISSHDPNIYI